MQWFMRLSTTRSSSTPLVAILSRDPFQCRGVIGCSIAKPGLPECQQWDMRIGVP
jgi:hypothetical protein